MVSDDDGGGDDYGNDNNAEEDRGRWRKNGRMTTKEKAKIGGGKKETLFVCKVLSF